MKNGNNQDWEFPGDLKRGATNDSQAKFNILIKVILYKVRQ